LKAQDVFRFMEDVPFLTRQDIEANFEDLWSTAVPKWRRKLVTTGGTSGAPLKFGLERTSYTTEFAYIADIWRRVGFSPWDKRLTVRGVAIPGDQVVRHRPFTNELQLSAFHLSDQHLSRAWPEVVRFQPAFLFGYPSAITALVKWNPQKVGALGLRAVLCGSEGLYPWQRTFLQEQLGVRVTSWYGHSEKSILGGECEVDTAYHFYPSYGFLEVVDDNGGPVPPDGTGEIVGTQFLSMAMPLIRYRTGDTATREPRSCSCARRYPLLRDAVGRWGQECLVGHSGAPISSAAINFHDETLFGIEALQFVQSVQGEAELLIQAGPSFPPERLPQIVASLKRKLKDELTVTVRLVPTIQRAPSGKVPIIRRSGRLETP
jgi:phenylacetate-CoA ligase